MEYKMSLGSTLWSWVYHFSGFLFVYYVFACISRIAQRSPMRKIKFIEKAVTNGNTTLGKISSHITYGTPAVHEIEYAYSVNGKIYFTTYIMHHPQEKIDLNDELQTGDVVAMRIPTTVTIYYDAKRPQKTVLKSEVFTGPCFVRWQRTKKKNKYRDIYKDWVSPIQL